MSDHKERAIICSGDEVRAILSGSKTQFREAIKPQPEDDDIYYASEHVKSMDYMEFDEKFDRGRIVHMCGNVPDPEPSFIATCPFFVGQRHWVRETWRPGNRVGTQGIKSQSWITYKADGSMIAKSKAGTIWTMARAGKWRPSVHMPRWASRLTLEVTDVRVERLQDISEADALADGGWVYGKCPYHKAPEKSFHHLWDTRNAKRGYSWDSNPWVWIRECKRAEGTA